MNPSANGIREIREIRGQILKPHRENDIRGVVVCISSHFLSFRLFSWLRAGLNRGSNWIRRVWPSSWRPGKAAHLLLWETDFGRCRFRRKRRRIENSPKAAWPQPKINWPLKIARPVPASSHAVPLRDALVPLTAVSTSAFSL